LYHTECPTALAVKSPRYADNYSDQSDTAFGFAHHAYARLTGSYIVNPGGWRDFIVNTSYPACDVDPSTCQLLAPGCEAAYNGPALTISNGILTLNT
jgi:hypothetical protein